MAKTSASTKKTTATTTTENQGEDTSKWTFPLIVWGVIAIMVFVVFFSSAKPKALVSVNEHRSTRGAVVTAIMPKVESTDWVSVPFTNTEPVRIMIPGGHRIETQIVGQKGPSWWFEVDGNPGKRVNLDPGQFADMMGGHDYCEYALRTDVVPINKACKFQYRFVPRK